MGRIIMQSIKKYTIHILAITAFNPKHFEIPFDLPDERNAVIICTGRSDDPVWLNPYYTPNTLAYYLLCKEAGIQITPEQVMQKDKQNEEAYIKLQQGIPCEYERWQILE